MCDGRTTPLCYDDDHDDEADDYDDVDDDEKDDVCYNDE